MFQDLEQLCSSKGYIHVLCYISRRDNFFPVRDELRPSDLASSYAADRTIRTELSTLMGLAVKHDISFEKIPNAEIVSMSVMTTGLLEELHDTFNKPMRSILENAFLATKSGIHSDLESPFGRGDVLREPIFYGGESAYNFQYRDLAVLRYADDEAWLARNKGFSIGEVHIALRALSHIQSTKFSDSWASSDWNDHNYADIIECFTVSSLELAEKTRLPQNTIDAILSSFTCPTSPTDLQFKSVSDFNEISAYPIIRDTCGNYIIIQLYALDEAFYDSPFYWIAADREYKDTSFSNRGKFTESFVAESFSKVFGNRNTHRAVNIYRGKNRISEADLLILFADRAIVVQCKSKKLTIESRKGNDQQIKSDFKKAIEDSYEQGRICAGSLELPDVVFIGNDGKNINIPRVKEIYIICVVSDHYPALAFQAREFLKVRSDAKILPPLICDVFLADVLTEILSSPLRLLSYLNRRVGYNDKIVAASEHSILGMHLKQNLWVGTDTDMMLVAEDFSLELDAAMTVRRMGVPGDATPKGILSKFDGTLIGRILKDSENRQDGGLLDFGFMLLTLSSDAIDDLNNIITQLYNKTQHDGQLHDFSVQYSEGKTGITVHCSRLSNEEAGRKLANHCQMRKYVTHSGSWFGLAVREADGLPKLGLKLEFPWQSDDLLEEATKGMAKGLRPSTPHKVRRPSKLGRNSPCSCGSGIKYKRCCL